MQSCYQAGVAYQIGDGTVKNIKIAKSLIEISCDGGFDNACAALQTIDEKYEDASSSREDMQVSSPAGGTDGDTLAADIKAYKNNCIKGDMASCYQVGTTYDGTNGVKYNLNLAKQFFDLSCEGGYYRACGDLAAVYMTKKFRDCKKTQYFAKIACDKEKENGCLILGKMYNNDDYFTKNKVLSKQYFSKALKYSLKNCSQSISFACYNAAWLYDTDVLGIKDEEKAKQFYAKACRLDSLDGCLAMAAIYELSRDMKKAVELYRKVCERYGGMCGYLAVLYRYGDSNLEKDPVLAKKYYRKACELGNEKACKEITP
jgi:TPR repeat protein